VSQADNLSERFQQLLPDLQHEMEIMLTHLKTTDSEIDCNLLENIITHHLHQLQESITALCKLLDDYQRGRLDTPTLLVLAQWT
jgi:hypothetical protein